MPKVTVQREIENVVIEEGQFEEITKDVKKELIDENKPITDENIEEKRRKRILDIATNMTMYDQGDNRLHNKITHRLED